jgi:hypothetical protein
MKSPDSKQGLAPPAEPHETAGNKDGKQDRIAAALGLQYWCGDCLAQGFCPRCKSQSARKPAQD